jgi:glucose/arabinose dehydrogenase
VSRDAAVVSLLLLSLSLLLSVACRPAVGPATAGPGAGASPTSVQGPPSPAPQPTSEPSPQPSAQPTRQPTAAPAEATLRAETLIRGLDTPWAIDFAPDGRIFISERPGRIRVAKDGQLLEAPWMQLPVVEVSESGLLGLALDPQFSQNHYVYAAYTYRTGDGRLANRLVRLRDAPAAGPGGQGTLDMILLESVPANNNHDGGRVRFGPDGKLYWTMGDAQNGQLAQDPALLNGKILRLNPDGSIPPDNPSPGSPGYSYGHRNPQGLAWQPGTGRLYATEHGPTGDQGRPCCLDEVNLIEPGRNYGWPVVAGDQTREGMESPLLHSGTNGTWAPGGATFVTHGPWTDSLLFTGLRGQALYRLTLDPDVPRRVLNLETLFQGQFGRLRDVVEGPEGALYLLTSNRDGRGRPGPEDDRVIRLTVG